MIHRGDAEKSKVNFIFATACGVHRKVWRHETSVRARLSRAVSGRKRTGALAPATGDFEMEVILKEDVPKLGHRGEVVKVAEGYGRNYLLPHKLAIEATAANRAVIEQMKQSAVRKSAVEKTA